MKEVTYNSSLLKDSWNSNETVKPNDFNELSGAVKNVIANANDLAHNYLQQGKQYVAGDIVYSKNLNKGCYLLCTQGGTTGDSEPQLINKNVGETVTDGTVVWTVQKVGNAQLNSSNTFTASNKFIANLAVSNGTTAGSGGRIDFGISPADETVQARISTDHLGGLFYHTSTNKPHVFRSGTNNDVLSIRADSSKIALTSNDQPFATVPHEGVAKWLGNANTATKLETARTINGVEFDGTKDITIEAAPLPTNTDGVGKWTVVSTTLPNGGMWAYFGFYTDSGGGVQGNSHYAGIAAGGTTVSSGSWRHTFCWRIS